MADGKIRMTVTIVYDVDLDNYEGCSTIKEAAELDDGQGFDALIALMEMSENLEITFEAVKE